MKILKHKALLSIFLGIMVPSVVETVFLYPDNLGKWNWIYVKNIILSFLALCALIAGSFVSVKDIIKMYSK